MPGPSISLRSAAVSEVDPVVSCVVAAFITDPVARFAWPKPHDHLRHFPAVIRAFAGGSFEHGTAYVTHDFCGAALWLPPGVHFDGDAVERLFRETVEPEHLDDMLGMFEEMDELHPDEPHWYLPLIGVEPNAQGRGLGGALMRHAVARCDREKMIAYLESSNPRNITLYERHGFERMGEIQVGAGPLMTPMLRQPR